MRNVDIEELSSLLRITKRSEYLALDFMLKNIDSQSYLLYTQKDIAAKLGLSRDVVYRVISKLRKFGFVSTKSRAVYYFDITKIRERLGSRFRPYTNL